MCSLEWWWNMGYHTLNLNTRYNIFCRRLSILYSSHMPTESRIPSTVGAALHAMFDNHFWIFVPEEKDVDIYYKGLIKIGNKNLADRTKFPSFNVSPLLCVHSPAVSQPT